MNGPILTDLGRGVDGVVMYRNRRPVSHLVSFPDASLSLSEKSLERGSHFNAFTHSRISVSEKDNGMFPIESLVDCDSVCPPSPDMTIKGFLPLIETCTPLSTMPEISNFCRAVSVAG